jgi:hypothetical protein
LLFGTVELNKKNGSNLWLEQIELGLVK